MAKKVDQAEEVLHQATSPTRGAKRGGNFDRGWPAENLLAPPPHGRTTRRANPRPLPSAEERVLSGSGETRPGNQAHGPSPSVSVTEQDLRTTRRERRAGHGASLPPDVTVKERTEAEVAAEAARLEEAADAQPAHSDDAGKNPRNIKSREEVLLEAMISTWRRYQGVADKQSPERFGSFREESERIRERLKDNLKAAREHRKRHGPGSWLPGGNNPILAGQTQPWDLPANEDSDSESDSPSPKIPTIVIGWDAVPYTPNGGLVPYASTKEQEADSEAEEVRRGRQPRTRAEEEMAKSYAAEVEDGRRRMDAFTATYNTFVTSNNAQARGQADRRLGAFVVACTAAVAGDLAGGAAAAAAAAAGEARKKEAAKSIAELDGERRRVRAFVSRCKAVAVATDRAAGGPGAEAAERVLDYEATICTLDCELSMAISMLRSGDSPVQDVARRLEEVYEETWRVRLLASGREAYVNNWFLSQMYAARDNAAGVGMGEGEGEGEKGTGDRSQRSPAPSPPHELKAPDSRKRQRR